VTARLPAGSLRVPAAWQGERLDRALAAHLELPRSRVAQWIRSGWVRLDGAPAGKTGEALRSGQELAWEPPPPVDDRVQPESGDLVLLHEDLDLLAFDKPPDLVVHPGAGRPTGTLVHRLVDRYPDVAGVGGAGRPGIVHRLDRGTSGVLVVARTPRAHERLCRAFAGREVDKRYLGITWGAPRSSEGVIEAPIGRDPRDRKRMAVIARGRPARTDYRVLARAAPLALVEFRLHTGRTHQIRVHARHIGHPLVGDPVYGEARWRGLPGARARPLATFPRPALHAWRLALAHPISDAPLALEAPVPEDLQTLWTVATGQAWPALPPATRAP
jgi:23S rRNA pseudouridine1911/1915/1917 synthase